MEKLDKIQILNELYNLILDKHIRTYERQCLLKAKNQIEAGDGVKNTLAELEATLRPLALRYNLTPKVTTFYQQIARDGLFAPGVGKIL